eukprot:c19950_g1_i1.p1 GENE.c19950_g1_i1~~c19950_g1_i1.p1  ORF type:complete len:632 (-),score=119.17 c19950_g1_i1:56-1906(-)
MLSLCTIRKCSSFYHLMFVICLAVLLVSMVTVGSIPAVITSIEKRFGLSSTRSGALNAVYDVAALSSIAPISYYGSRWHEAKTLAVVVFFFGIGTFLFAVPHFITEVYSPLGHGDTGICSISNIENCSPTKVAAYAVLVISQIICGMSAAPLYTIAPSYIDKNVSNEKSAFFLGIMYAVSAVGPALGYVITGKFLEIYVNPDVSTTLNPRDTQWIGAWWASFILSAGCLFMVSPLFCCFPRKFQKEELVKHIASQEIEVEQPEGREQEVVPVPQIIPEIQSVVTQRSLRKDVIMIIKNPIFFWTTLGTCADSLVLNGVATFLPKLLEILLNLTSSDAAFLSGAVFIPAAAAGMFCGGYFGRRFSLDMHGSAKLSFITSLIAVSLLFFFYLDFDQPPIIGINQPYKLNSTFITLEANCNSDCRCVSRDYAPVCGSDGSTYFSACYAGCLVGSPVSGYTNCSCIPSSSNSTTLTTGTAKFGICSIPKPPNQSLMIGALFFIVFFQFINICPTAVIFLRVFGQELSPLVLSLNSVSYRALGSIPGPLVYGYLLDRACVLANSACGNDSCEIYDVRQMKVAFLLVGLCCKIIALIGYGVATWYTKKDKIIDHTNVNITPV